MKGQHHAPHRAVSQGALRIPDAGAEHHDQEIPVKACLAPKELYQHIVEAGIIKSQWRWDKQVALGLIAAFYIGFSYTAMMVVGGQIPGIQHGENPGLYNLILGCFGFPLGLFMICVVGADLFTSDCSYMMTAYWEGRIRWWDVVRSWFMSWWVNLAGSIIMALIVYWAWIFDGRSDFVLYFAQKKTSNPFSVCLCKGILANWLVNLAVWIANCSQDVTGKAVGIFLPISAFIAMGGEHCIANQYLFALASLLGSDVPTSHFITKNLIPSTIGNIIGGAFFVATMYGFAIGTLYDNTYSKTASAYRSCRKRIRVRSPRASASGKSKQTPLDNNAKTKTSDLPATGNALNSILTRFKAQAGGNGNGGSTSSSMVGLVGCGQEEGSVEQQAPESNSIGSNPPAHICVSLDAVELQPQLPASGSTTPSAVTPTAQQAGVVLATGQAVSSSRAAPAIQRRGTSGV